MYLHGHMIVHGNVMGFQQRERPRGRAWLWEYRKSEHLCFSCGVIKVLIWKAWIHEVPFRMAVILIGLVLNN